MEKIYCNVNLQQQSVSNNENLGKTGLILEYLRVMLPTAYSQVPILQRFWIGIQEDHLLTRTFKAMMSGFNPAQETQNVPFALLSIQLITYISLSSFFIALFYDVQNPSDDGSCSLFMDESSCLHRKTLLDPWQTYCTWEEKPSISAGMLLEMKGNVILKFIKLVQGQNSKEMDCIYNENSSSMVAAIALIVLNTLLTIPISTCLHFIIRCLNSRTIEALDTTATTDKTNEANTKWFITSYQVTREMMNIKENMSVLGSKNDYLMDEHYSSASIQFPETTTSMANPSHSLNLYRYMLSILKFSAEDAYGACILHNLYIDLLGRHSAAGRLFWSYVKRDFIQIQYVSRYLQYFAIVALIMLNGGAIYYIMLKGVTRGKAWQAQFLRYYAFSFLSDAFFVQLLELVWMEVLLPSMVYKEVLEISKLLVSFLHSLEGSMRVDQLKENIIRQLHDNFEDSPLLLLTRNHPFLLESRLVRAHIQELQSVTVKGNIHFFLQLFAYLPLQIHSIFAGIASSMILTFSIFVWYENPLIVVGIIIFCFLMMMLWTIRQKIKSEYKVNSEDIDDRIIIPIKNIEEDEEIEYNIDVDDNSFHSFDEEDEDSHLQSSDDYSYSSSSNHSSRSYFSNNGSSYSDSRSDSYFSHSHSDSNSTLDSKSTSNSSIYHL